MVSFVPVNNGDLANASSVQQIIDAWQGAANKGVPFSGTAVNDPVNFALAAKNLDATNSRAAVFYKADGTVLLQIDKNGVVASPDGVSAAAQVLTVNSAINTGTVVATLTNHSGGTVVTGDVVVLDLTNDSSFVTSSTAGDPNRAGVVLDASILANASGRVLLSGVGQVHTVGAVARGDWLSVSTTPKQAANSSTMNAPSFARALQTTGAGGLVSALLLGPGAAGFSYVVGTLNANVNMPSNAFVDGPSVSLAPGVWLVMGRILVHGSVSGTTGSQCAAKMWDSTTTYAYVEAGGSAGNNGGTNSMNLATIIVLGATTTIKISASDNQATGGVPGTILQNANTGIFPTNTPTSPVGGVSTQILGVRIG